MRDKYKTKYLAVLRELCPHRTSTPRKDAPIAEETQYQPIKESPGPCSVDPDSGGGCVSLLVNLVLFVVVEVIGNIIAFLIHLW